MAESPTARLSWYLARLRAMNQREVFGHLRRKWRQRLDQKGFPPVHHFGTPTSFPSFKPLDECPSELRAGLEVETQEILAGSWKAFGWLDLKVDMPPQWHTDYLAKVDCATKDLAFRLNHRNLPAGADVKLIWELSRWHPLTRLCMAAHLLDQPENAYAALRLLEHWVHANPPFRGWNWTSALESGMRLIQFTWIEALVHRFAGMHHLVAKILPVHCYFTWRYRSFGSSANNHLLGELAGLAVSMARWPALSRWSTDPASLHRLFEREILAQFSPDGGNKEQALNYQLFSWEFCWHARAAFQSLNLPFSQGVEDRLGAAADFFTTVQNRGERWDYGDSDDATVLPLYQSHAGATTEWLNWLESKPGGESIRFWIGKPPEKRSPSSSDQHWQIFPDSGIAAYKDSSWRLRWDLSPLGYLATAAHGHLDALHLTIWMDGVCFVIDPGTGAYYADKPLRSWLASHSAHNGPALVDNEFPRRLGPFLWSKHHEPPVLKREGENFSAIVKWQPGHLQRRLQKFENGWRVEDTVHPAAPFKVHWHFAPDSQVAQVGPGEYAIRRRGRELRVRFDGECTIEQPEPKGFTGICAPHFRKTSHSPVLIAHGHKSCVLGTTFLACPTS
jgi:hypothetical protein